MPAPDLARAQWRKSSLSANGSECVEVAAVADWRKSTRSGNGAHCVEAAAVADWRKPNRSGHGAARVEAAPAEHAVAVRDSKKPQGAKLAVPAPAWRAFTSAVKHGRYRPAA